MYIPKNRFTGTVSALTLLAACLSSGVAHASGEQTNNYRLKLMAQIFDGQREFSNTQTSTIGRVRKGKQSYTLMDFGDQSVVIEGRNKALSASNFKNTTGIEAEFIYNYDTKTLSGSNDSARYFNRHIRPYLTGSPALGKDAKWSKIIPLEALSTVGVNGDNVKISLKRDYFTHKGKDYVLLHYQISAFSYVTASGQSVVHWGEGVTVTDPGFGEIYWNATFQRALAEEVDGSMRPYRVAKTLAATDNKGRTIFDPRKVKMVRAYFDKFYGGEKMEVLGFHAQDEKPDQSPIRLAANLDMLALALAENSANPAPQLSNQYLNGSTGFYTLSTPGSQEAGANTANSDSLLFGTPNNQENAAQEQVHIQGNASSNNSTSSPVQESAANANRRNAEIREARIRQLESSENQLYNTDVKPPRNVGSSQGDYRGPSTGKPPIEIKDFGTVSGNGDNGASTVTETLDVATVQTGNIGNVRGPTPTQTQINAAGSNLVDLAQLLDDPSKLLPLLEVAGNNQKAAESVVKDIGRLESYIEQTTVRVKSINHTLKAVRNEYKAVEGAITKLESLYNAQAKGISTIEGMSKGPIVDTIKKLGDLVDREKRLAASIKNLGKEASTISVALKETQAVRKQLPSLLKAAKNAGTSFGRFAKNITNGLDKLAKPLSALGFIADGSKLLTVTRDLGNFSPDDKDLRLGSSYDLNGGFYEALALDLLGIAGSAKTGGIYAVASGVTAFSVGRFADLYKAIKAAEHAEGEAKYAHKQYILTMMKRTNQLSEIEATKLQDLLNTEYGLYTNEDPYKDGYDVTHPSWDKKTGYWRIGTRKWKEAEAAKAAELAAKEAAATRAAQIKRNKEIEEANARIRSGEAYGEVGYPQVDPAKDRKPPKTYITPDFTGGLGGGLIGSDISDAEDKKRRNQIKKDLDAYQQAYLAKQREEQARKDRERIARIKDGTLNIDPVTFSPPVWSPPTFKPPEWVPPRFTPVEWTPPEFTPVEQSDIAFTTFDGSDDWTFGTGITSNDYNAFTGSGTFNPDLSEWAEWLATQNLRELKRLARTAGYPNLAAALRDWQNLIKKANDDGFRQWAGRPPVCYMACAGGLGQWHLKASQLALGDILNKSREIFSTAGLSDVSISGFTLRYILRDFGAEDGDLINIMISQFGRTIFETELSLLNAGTDYEINLRPGVASIVITAINEGAFSPNTAEIKLQDIVEGESTQTYRLLEGEKATLRVNPGRVGGKISGASSSSALSPQFIPPPLQPAPAPPPKTVPSIKFGGPSIEPFLGGDIR